jgi:hypothetical protein
MIPDNLTLEGGSRQLPPVTREPARIVRLLRRPPQGPLTQGMIQSDPRSVAGYWCSSPGV